MYEINTHNLKLYLIVLSIIFILTNGFPLLHMFSDIDEGKTLKYNKYDNLKGEKFIMVNNKYYPTNATVVKHSIVYNTNTNYFSGNVILEYINYIDNHHYCKIDIVIPELKQTSIIYNYLYKYCKHFK